jgi:hypothetical protein
MMAGRRGGGSTDREGHRPAGPPAAADLRRSQPEEYPGDDDDRNGERQHDSVEPYLIEPRDV